MKAWKATSIRKRSN